MGSGMKGFKKFCFKNFLCVVAVVIASSLSINTCAFAVSKQEKSELRQAITEIVGSKETAKLLIKEFRLMGLLEVMVDLYKHNPKGFGHMLAMTNQRIASQDVISINPGMSFAFVGTEPTTTTSGTSGSGTSETGSGGGTSTSALDSFADTPKRGHN